MIYCNIQDDGRVFVLETKGHALKENGSYSITCAAVSTLIRSFGQVLSKQESISLHIENFQQGLIRLSVQNVRKESLPWFQGVKEFLIQGLSDIQNDYPDQIKLDFRYTR